MTGKEKNFFLLSCALLLGVVCLVFVRMKQMARPMLTTATLSLFHIEEREHFTPDKGQFILIQFGDYECPACYGQQKAVDLLLMQNVGKLRLIWRQFPLEKIHPNAHQVALLSEIARAQGQFDTVHHRLMALQGHLTKHDLKDILQLAKIDYMTLLNTKGSSEKRVQEDKALAEVLGCRGTPMFYLATPEGKVYHLRGLHEVGSFLPVKTTNS